jgi:hypothetical protein
VADCVVCMVIAIMVIPVLAYLVVKLGTYGYLRARQKFQEENENGNES